ncbi:MAG: patatin-like phospholipase family protein, partial [Pricia sp.]|nr:patatin-like phospholipase family protein [Pricia sp.]
MRHLGISGGGTKIAGLFGVAESIIYDRGYMPEVISGISAGAILALPLALGKREEIKTQVLNIT